MPGEEERGKERSEGESSFPFEETYSKYFHRILEFMSTRVRNRENARDCAQEVFLRFMKTNPHPSSIKKNLASYIHGIAKKVAADFLSGSLPFRSETRKEAEPVLEISEERLLETYTVEKSFRRLNMTDRKILTYYFWVGEKHREIASRLGMNHDQVRQRFHRALGKLKEHLEDPSLSQKGSPGGRNRESRG